MADLKTQLENHEQRCQLSSKGTLLATMPGSQVLADGAHTVGHIPTGALISGFQAWINPTELFGANVTVSLGTADAPTLFLNAVVLTDGSSVANAATAPVELYVSNEPLVATITTTVKNSTARINFNVDYTEVDTKAGKYTH